jgi:hypothetical protein
MTNRISPLNLTAQLNYRPRGTPPGGLASSSVGNFYPGLEIDLRNLWRRLFVGIVLHEAVAVVMAAEDDASDEIKALVGEILLTVDGKPVWVEVTGPRTPGAAPETLGQFSLEWSNALADAVRKQGQTVLCRFSKGEDDTQEAALTVRPVFETAEVDGGDEATSLLSRELALAGELTQSLCSPWQNDFIGCGCYYWAASRPDYVNVENDGGVDKGQNWLERGRDASTPIRYTLRPSDLLQHEDIIRSWEDKLTFVIKGRDRP